MVLTKNGIMFIIGIMIVVWLIAVLLLA